MTITITNHPDQHRYEAHIDGQLAGYCEYNVLSNAVMFTHTEVLPAFEGQGVGSALARHVLDDARTQATPVIPACQFIAGYIRKHREYLDVVQPASLRAFHIE
ncbi:GNAT family N-acetyltransferase [Variovorax sp. KK3]|uniref:GNAT family N-acetyltransferase n=1 Tax=Variovorax sp. KK3 TaxID=1855728 RepID=UPI00097C5ACA|nr:GNAT family N-acetyltransferase [Variovorax sp. KK3]